MKEHEGCVKAFHWTGKAYYGRDGRTFTDGSLDEIMIGMYAPEGGTSGEFGIRWYELGGKVTPQLRVWDDAFDVLGRFQDLLSFLAEHDSEGVSASTVAVFLRNAGYQDMTAYDSPYSDDRFLCSQCGQRLPKVVPDA
jgi:hypothetical protein